MVAEFNERLKNLSYNLEEGNYHEALYFTDLMLYMLQQEDLPDTENKLKKVLFLKGRALEGLNRIDEAKVCYGRAGYEP
jgi:hypothetical protein